MIEDLTFLEEADFTIRDDNVKEVVRTLRQSTRTPWGAVSEHVSQLRNDDSKKSSEFRKRTASEILKSGYVTGCTDTALAFLVLARELGIPARYVETFDENWLQEANANGVQGHIFADILINGNWRVYEPKKGFTPDNTYSMSGRKYAEVGKGLDFSQVYIKENGIYRPMPTRLQSLDEAVRIFKPSSK